MMFNNSQYIKNIGILLFILLFGPVYQPLLPCKYRSLSTVKHVQLAQNIANMHFFFRRGKSTSTRRSAQLPLFLP
jgi:hypothetical protein